MEAHMCIYKRVYWFIKWLYQYIKQLIFLHMDNPITIMTTPQNFEQRVPCISNGGGC